MRKETPSTFTRATLARAAGVGVETLRFYEQKQVIEPPDRNASGYRIYGQADLDRLHFIQRAQGLGFSLEEIKELLSLTGDVKTPRAKVREFAEARLATIRQKIETLRAMERALSGLVGECDGAGPLTGCPIVEFVGGKSEGGCHEGGARRLLRLVQAGGGGEILLRWAFAPRGGGSRIVGEVFLPDVPGSGVRPAGRLPEVRDGAGAQSGVASRAEDDLHLPDASGGGAGSSRRLPEMRDGAGAEIGRRGRRRSR